MLTLCRLGIFSSITKEGSNSTYVPMCDWPQCDQKKIAKCLLKLPKNDFTRKIIDFDTIIKIA